jgi:hypothetical protein
MVSQKTHPNPSLFNEQSSFLKEGLSQPVKKHRAKAPSFKTIFDWRREKGLGMSQNSKAAFLQIKI